ncbi:prolyl oligopeptidase family serine peptidase [bacterium]|nr:prolyl oligopeptidase family serine peptidase [bacterium]
MSKHHDSNPPAGFSMTRRNLLQAAGMGLLGAALPGCATSAAKAKSEAPATPVPPSASSLSPLNRFPRMTQEYFIDQVRRAQAAGQAIRDSLRTRADAERYVAMVREKIRASFGPMPKKTPLKPRVTGVVERDAYIIEKVIFSSRPGYLVTANLYIPKGRKFPLPGVVGTCGHFDTGKACPAYQSFAQGLARQGYVVLIFDPPGQGERWLYYDGPGKSRSPGGVGREVGLPVREHLCAGNQQYLVDEFIGSWFVWDGIRALDYLLTRKEVDPRRIGVTGNSGGGTQTAWLCGLEQRWTMAAPSCFVTTFLRNMENELPADTEQCPPRALALGLDHGDFIAAMAPKPVILLTKEMDFFDIRGGEEAYARLKKLYTLLDAPDNIAIFTGAGEHGYSQDNREAMYRWFNRTAGMDDPGAEPKLTIEDEKTLRCTPNGLVAELNSKPIFAFTREKSQALAKKRAKLEGDALGQAVAEMLKLKQIEGVPEFNILRSARDRKYPKPATHYVVETEPGISSIVAMLQDEKARDSRPSKSTARAILYVSHQSADAELRGEPLIRELLEAEPGATFFACDVRGIGESQPFTCDWNSFLDPYGSDYFYAAHSIMLDRPYVGQRTGDVLRVLEWLKSFGHNEVHLAASGWGTLPATFAALLAPQVVQVTLKGAPASYSALAENEQYHWPLSSLLPGVLKRFDLPDCYRQLQAKGLRMI